MAWHGRHLKPFPSPSCAAILVTSFRLLDRLPQRISLRLKNILFSQGILEYVILNPFALGEYIFHCQMNLSHRLQRIDKVIDMGFLHILIELCNHGRFLDISGTIDSGFGIAA